MSLVPLSNDMAYLYNDRVEDYQHLLKVLKMLPFRNSARYRRRRQRLIMSALAAWQRMFGKP